MAERPCSYPLPKGTLGAWLGAAKLTVVDGAKSLNVGGERLQLPFQLDRQG